MKRIVSGALTVALVLSVGVSAMAVDGFSRIAESVADTKVETSNSSVQVDNSETAADDVASAAQAYIAQQQVAQTTTSTQTQTTGTTASSQAQTTGAQSQSTSTGSGSSSSNKTTSFVTGVAMKAESTTSQTTEETVITLDSAQIQAAINSQGETTTETTAAAGSTAAVATVTKKEIAVTVSVPVLNEDGTQKVDSNNNPVYESIEVPYQVVDGKIQVKLSRDVLRRIGGRKYSVLVWLTSETVNA